MTWLVARVKPFVRLPYPSHAAVHRRWPLPNRFPLPHSTIRIMHASVTDVQSIVFMPLDHSPYRPASPSFDARSRGTLDARPAHTRAHAALARTPAWVTQGWGGATSPPKSFISCPLTFLSWKWDNVNTQSAHCVNTAPTDPASHPEKVIDFPPARWYGTGNGRPRPARAVLLPATAAREPAHPATARLGVERRGVHNATDR